MSSLRNCSIENEEEDIENKADKRKHKIKQSKQKQEKNVSKLYIGNLNPSIKENGHQLKISQYTFFFINNPFLTLAPKIV